MPDGHVPECHFWHLCSGGGTPSPTPLAESHLHPAFMTQAVRSNMKHRRSVTAPQRGQERQASRLNEGETACAGSSVTERFADAAWVRRTRKQIAASISPSLKWRAPTTPHVTALLESGYYCTSKRTMNKHQHHVCWRPSKRQHGKKACCASEHKKARFDDTSLGQSLCMGGVSIVGVMVADAWNAREG